MIEAAEQRGDIKPGATLVEGTAGNTGIGLALVAQQKGYKLILVVPDKMSREKIFNLKAMGAEVVLTRSDVAKGHPDYYQDMAKRIAERNAGRLLHQSVRQPGQSRRARIRYRPGDPAADERSRRLDAIVFGCGSSGTMTGLSRCFAQYSPHTELILADPVGSILTEYINEGTLSEKSGSWMVEGIGEDFLPDISDFTPGQEGLRHHRQGKLPRRARIAAQRRHSRRVLHRHVAGGGAEILPRTDRTRRMCWSSSATPATSTCRSCTTTTGCSTTASFEREQHGDLRDLILRPYTQRDTVVVGPNDLLITAYQRMKLYDISQLPVMEGERIVGILDESDVLLHVYGDEAQFRDPVSTAMVSKLDMLDVRSPVEALLPVFDRGHVAIVMDGERFLGLITRIDLLNWLRRRVQ